MATCIFCGNSAKLTKEHVLPQWIGATPIGEGPLDIRIVDRNGTVYPRRAHSVDIIARVVCAACNHGWMNDLETAARPSLTAMMNGELQHLASDEQLAVARWATKTAVMLLYAFPDPLGASPVHRAQLFEGKLPINTGIWIAAYRADPPAYNSWIRVRPVEMRPDPRPNDIRVAIAVTLSLGHYVQHVLLTPNEWTAETMTFTAPAALLDRVVFIPQSRTVSWPPTGQPLGIPELEQYADAFSAVGFSTPSSDTL